MKKCVIICAAEIKNYKKISEYISPDAFIIACDGGLNHLEKLEQRGQTPIKPDLIVGDFDSHPAPEPVMYPDSEIISLPKEKDWTDSYYAAMEAVKRGFTDVILIGAIGQRFDHSLVNISAMLYLQENGANPVIIDDYSEMELVVAEKPKNISDNYKYFSLLCVAGDVSGVTICGAKYPLENGEIKTSFQYASSNEVLPGKTATVSVEKGVLLLIKVW